MSESEKHPEKSRGDIELQRELELTQKYGPKPTRNDLPEELVPAEKPRRYRRPTYKQQ